MKKIRNWKSISAVLWIAITILILTTMPNVDKLIKEKGQVEMPKTEQSVKADKILKKMEGKNNNTYDIISVFNSGSKKELTDKQIHEINKTVNKLSKNKKKLGIKQISKHTDSKELEKQLVSDDKTTILTQLSVDTSEGDISKVSNNLNKVINQTKEVDTYLTGSDLISTDFGKSTQDGVEKTEIIAIIFILLVLIIVFKSPIVPLISLLTVGIAYLVSWGILTNIVDNFNFPFSDFTQVFIIVVLFGIGTDYNILLYTRFKEELSKNINKQEAVIRTFKTAGKTVLYSGLAVFIGFASLLLANFKLYQATSGVAIAVAILLLVLVTLNPFFMALLGKKMFYPVKNFKGHKDSKMWHFLSIKAVKAPLITITLILALSTPFIANQSKDLNFNDLWEVGDKYESKQGIKVIEKHFPPGFSSPASLAIESENKLDNINKLKMIDKLTQNISKIDGVSKVVSATRPTGEKIDQFYSEGNELYIPKNIIDSQEVQGTLDMYMSKDRKISNLNIILDVNPYKKKAMPIIKKIDKEAEDTINEFNHNEIEYAVGGTTSTNADLKEVSQGDFIKTAIIMLIGIGLVLFAITRSFLNSIFVVGSLVLVYFTSIGISEWIIHRFLGIDLLSWNVPFFSFIMIVALGVDYSIFVLMRFNELNGTPKENILNASKHMGGVVLSAALILGGTFAALLPSGVLTLIEVAIVVVIALILLSFVAMPILLPALITLVGKLKRNIK